MFRLVIWMGSGFRSESIIEFVKDPFLADEWGMKYLSEAIDG